MFDFIDSIMVAFAEFMTVQTTGMSMDDTFYGLEGIYQAAYVIRTYEHWLDLAPLCISLIVLLVFLIVYFVYSVLTAEWEEDEETDITVA